MYFSIDILVNGNIDGWRKNMALGYKPDFNASFFSPYFFDDFFFFKLGGLFIV